MIPLDVTTVIACSWFSWECWWYPLLFLLSYFGVFVMVGALAGASDRGMIYLALSGLTLGALAATLMGMLTVTMPLLLMILTVIYAVRF